MSQQTKTTTELDINDVEFDGTVYPRFEVNEDAVDRYRQVIDELPAIIVSEGHRLIDGYHRLKAHRVEGKSTIEAKVLPISDDGEVFAEAARRNSTHGQQLTTDEKKTVARRLYKQADFTQSEIAEKVSMSAGWVSDKTRDIRQEERDERRQQSYELYLDYAEYPTESDVADELDVDRSTVNKDRVKIFKSEDFHTPSGSPEITNNWRIQQCDGDYGRDWPGRVPGQAVANLLHYFTDPWDLVVDPMAGGGTTVDVCKAMARRYAAFDINPLEDKNINQHDVTESFPVDANTADFVHLDPPYQRLKSDEYVDGSLAELDADEFVNQMGDIVRSAFKATASGGHVAMWMQPFTNSGVTETFTDYTFEILNATNDAPAELRQRISVPLNFDTYSPQAVSHAKENEYLIDQNRDIVIWEVDG
jgi:transcriptional regulator with XRE-family HTH domain